jgi:hypothetical protein
MRRVRAGTLHEPLPRQLGAGAQRLQLGLGDIAVHRRHAAVGGGDDVLLRHELHGVLHKRSQSVN